jgi:carbonic anhydrase/acetyltransferase-like protein (isoleucine patch superfamily)
MPLYSVDGRRPKLPPKDHYWVAPNATLIGDVTLGLDVGIWFGAVLRGDNEPIVIGARSNIQESCTLHTDMGWPLVVGEDCTIGHNVVLHGCAIGDGSLIGMGAILLNGAKIGRGSLVGGGALVTEGKTMDDYSLIVGSPAKAVRTLDKEAVEGLRRAAASYVNNWRRYAQSLQPVPSGE